MRGHKRQGLTLPFLTLFDKSSIMDHHQPPFDFAWNSTLGYSVMLFLLITFLYLVLGVVTPLTANKYCARWTELFGLVFSPRSDKAAFGKSAKEIVDQDPSVMVTKISIYQLHFGMYLAVAILHFCLVWFGLRHGHAWALWALAASDVAIVFFFLMAVRTFSTQLTQLHFGDLPPFIYVPGMILPFAVILGWLGLR